MMDGTINAKEFFVRRKSWVNSFLVEVVLTNSLNCD